MARMTRPILLSHFAGKPYGVARIGKEYAVVEVATMAPLAFETAYQPAEDLANALNYEAARDGALAQAQRQRAETEALAEQLAGEPSQIAAQTSPATEVAVFAARSAALSGPRCLWAWQGTAQALAAYLNDARAA